MTEVNENRFLIAVIRSLLVLCEERKGKENKAVVASNIMYIVGQYPRFLRAHWKFLKTVVNKLFEFMHENFPGVQDMACDTFIKIAQKCKRKFMTPQTEDPQPFILTLIRDISKHTQHLQPHQVQSFYESVGTMLSDHGPAIRFLREEVILRLMDVPNTSWREIIMTGSQNIQSLFNVECVIEVSRILKINVRVCVASGSIFVHQLKTIFMDILTVYRLYSEHITAAVAREGAVATRIHLYKVMRGVKSDILELMTVFMEACKDIEGGPQSALQVFLPPLMTEVLNDYRTAPPSARDPKVLTLFSTAICILKENISSEIPHIMDAIFEPTLQMITANMLDHPEHRIGFYRFLREANEYCFYGLFSVAPQSQKLVVDSIVWAFKHTERNISETGLELLEKLLLNIEPNLQISQPFYQAFLLSLIQDIISVMSDRTHKSGFKLQATILKHLCHVVQSGSVQVPLFDPVKFPGIDNSEFLKGHISQLLIEAFPNLTGQQVTSYVLGLFDTNLDINAFKQHLRDFLVEVKEFANEDNSELFAEETAENLEKNLQNQWKYRASVPGLLKPDEYELDESNYENNDDEK
jgi:exportin-1